MADEVDVRIETVMQLEYQIEKNLGIQNEPASDILADVENDEVAANENEEARLKITTWAGGYFSVFLDTFSDQISITKEQAESLGKAWGGVVGKWYPVSWLSKSESVGDSISSFNPELEAVKETWDVFGDRFLKKLKVKKLGRAEVKVDNPTSQVSDMNNAFPPTEGVKF